MIDKVINCTNCEACRNICPVKCISKKSDEYKQEYAVIDRSKCIKCGMCESVCPEINEVRLNYGMKCYAAYRKDTEARLDSASGGIAAFFYEDYVKNDGVICGVKYDKEFVTYYSLGQSKEDIAAYKGSKYVHAEMREVYNEIDTQLKNGKKVLFIGLPCQVAGLSNYIKIKNKQMENLLLIDIICHGTCPSAYLQDEVNYLMQRYRISNIDNVIFRSNRPKMHFTFSLFNKKNTIKGYEASRAYYSHAFLRGISLNESCYSCRYARPERVSDITIGDFINLGKIEGFPKFEGEAHNASMIMCNTQKGVEYIEGLDLTEMVIFERNVEEGVLQGISMRQPYPKHKLRDKFLSEIEKSKNFSKAIRKVTKTRIIYNRYLCRYINFIFRRVGIKQLKER